MDPICTRQERITHLIMLLGPIPTWKVDATISKLWCTTYITLFSKWPPAKWNYVFAYDSSSRIDRDTIWVFKAMFFWTRNPIMTLKIHMTLGQLGIQWTPHAPARNVWILFYFVTWTYPNLESGCHHHQIGMDRQRNEITFSPINEDLE